MQNAEEEVIQIPPEMEQNFPEESKMLCEERFEDAFESFDNRLATALADNDVEAAERILGGQMFTAAVLGDKETYVDIRVMRLELFYKTDQKEKAYREYDALSLQCTDERLDNIREITGYSHIRLPKPLNKQMLEEVDTFFIVDNLYNANNGVLHSVLRKMTAMEDAWDYRTFMVVSNYNVELANIVAELKHFSGGFSSRLSMGLRVLSVFEYFQKTNAPDLLIKEYSPFQEGLEYREVGRKIYEVYNDSRKIRKESYTAYMERLRSIEYYNENGIRNRMVMYDDKGYISMIRSYDIECPEHYPTEVYYTTSDKVCMIATYEYQPDDLYIKHKLTHLTVYNEDGQVLKECADNAELVALFLERIVVSTNKVCLLVNESGLFSKSLINLPHRNVIAASMVHAAFLINPYDLSSPAQHFYKDLIKHHHLFDGIAFLTDDARKDFYAIYGSSKRTFTIPHFYPRKIEKTDFDKRDHMKAVIVARLDPIKRLSEAISIFRIVADELPEARLDIYGFGSEGKKLQELIEKMDLKGIVTLKGSTNVPENVFRGAALSMLTSYIEGYAITVMESICNGCPPFSYDIKFGPREIIKKDETGFLFGVGDTETYAKQMIEFFKDVDLQKKMSENAYKDAPRFSKEAFLEQWHDFMEALLYN